MQCPTCKTNLLMNDRKGIEIDYCPSCRGVWLDRGELDKIIERSNNELSEQTSIQGSQYSNDEDFEDDDGNDRGNNYSNRGRNNQRKRGEGFLSNLFEFGE
jgi:Zn-finger nucleic acid-binding protein